MLAGLGTRRRTAGIRELRALVPDVVDSFVATLTETQLQRLRADLAVLGFRGRGAVGEFGQSVVTEIRRQREGVFRGVTSGGLPGSRR